MGSYVAHDPSWSFWISAKVTNDHSVSKKNLYIITWKLQKIILKTRVVEPCSLASNSTGGSAAGRKILRPAMPATMKNAAWMFGSGKPHMMSSQDGSLGAEYRHCFSRWWFHVFFCSQIFGEDLQFDSYFQMGWNHKLVLERETPNKKNRLALTFGENGCFLLLKFHLLGSETRNP